MFNLLLGHLVGDYLLQNNWMAENKHKHLGLGWLTCTVHCLLYTAAVCFFTWEFSLLWIVCVFLSHFIIDKFALAERYLKIINGRSIGTFLASRENQEYSPHIGLRASLVVLVYVVVDNTMHLLLMALAWKLLHTM